MPFTLSASKGPVLPDGKTPKLRASCDACNESKVRCTQTKPVCARCEKQGFQCIYGLSRRSHKDAPRVKAPQSSKNAMIIQQDRSQPWPTPPLNPHGGMSMAAAEDALFAQPMDLHHNFDLQLGQHAMHMDHGGHHMDDTSMIPLSPLDHMSATLGATHDIPELMPLGPSMSETPSFDLLPNNLAGASTMITDPGLDSQCACNSNIAQFLVLSKSLSFGKNADGEISFDVHLSEFKRAMKLCEDCIKCEHGLHDETSIGKLSICSLVAIFDRPTN